MSAPAASSGCPTCGAAIVPGSRFCGQCGRRLDGDAAADLPVDREAPRPDVTTSERHLFGVTPVLAAVVVGAAAVAVGILLVALDEVIVGAVVIVVGAVLLLLLAAGAPQLRRSRSSVGARASQLATTTRARSRARRRLATLRRERDELERARREGLVRLGEAVYRSDAAETDRVRAEVEGLDAELAAKEEAMAAIAAEARQHVERAQLQAQPTEMVELPDPSPPYPPPDEGTPPEPPRIPEPYPPPDEGTPPEPARIPEPEPPTERA
ncbi:MAG: zinc ribbon domain-containing protein [Pseudomonadota bacterium]